jgi:hypothetical protein
MHHPAQSDYNEFGSAKRVANKPDSRGNLFSSLMRQFANY